LGDFASFSEVFFFGETGDPLRGEDGADAVAAVEAEAASPEDFT
jgi:hypothetical protein